jgi:tetratricopeptide (TPR) repeat protein
MANRRALIVLDGIGPRLPLGQALDALLAPSYSLHTAHTPSRIVRSGNVVLTTSRHIPVPATRAYRLALDPLAPAAAYELFICVLGRPLDPRDAHWVEAICAALGYLPLAVELAAVTVGVRRIPLSVLAARLQEHPLDRILDVDGELRSRIAAALATVDSSAQQRFALLSAFRSDTFSLEAAAAIGATSGDGVSHARLGTSTLASSSRDPSGSVTWGFKELGQSEAGRIEREVTAELAQAATDLGELVQHSLLEPIPNLPDAATDQRTTAAAGGHAVSAEQARYRIHPLLRAHASEHVGALAAGASELATRQAQEYAIGYAGGHRGDLLLLERERDLLVAALLGLAESGQHAQARDLALDLRGVVGRSGVDPTGERALLVGARAANEVGDRHAMVRFLYRLGILHYYRGAYATARRIWEDALAIGEGLGDLPYTRLPVRGFGMLAEAYGEREEALRYTAAYKQACLDEGDRFAIAGGLISHAFQLRIMGRVDESLVDASACLEIMLPSDRGEATPYEHIVAVEAQMELARLAGDYQQAQALTEKCVSLNRRYRDHIMGVECLVDQAEFAYGRGELTDAQALACGAADLAAAIGAVGQQARACALLARF